MISPDNPLFFYSRDLFKAFLKESAVSFNKRQLIINYANFGSNISKSDFLNNITLLPIESIIFGKLLICKKAMEERPLILITNDDGVYAKGLIELIEVIRLFGNIVVVAPDSPRSGMGHAITVDHPLRVTRLQEDEGLLIYSFTGTPADCIKLACNQLLEKLPDFIISGINHGANTSVSILYSGTMGAALEGCIHGVPSIGFSLNDYSPEADFSKSKMVVARVFQAVAERGLPEGVCLNVNIPQGEVKGINFCRQTRGKWMEEFERRTDPHGREYYWLKGYFNNAEAEARDTDDFALLNGFVSVVPVNTDLTAYTAFPGMQKWKF